MKYNLKNILWELNPQRAKNQFEKELREFCEYEMRGIVKPEVRKFIKEILGEDE